MPVRNLESAFTMSPLTTPVDTHQLLSGAGFWDYDSGSLLISGPSIHSTAPTALLRPCFRTVAPSFF